MFNQFQQGFGLSSACGTASMSVSPFHQSEGLTATKMVNSSSTAVTAVAGIAQGSLPLPEVAAAFPLENSSPKTSAKVSARKGASSPLNQTNATLNEIRSNRGKVPSVSNFRPFSSAQRQPHITKVRKGRLDEEVITTRLEF